ncbi:MAG: hypothetical protein L3J45_02460 [Flavobacteriaceae bacterium]|nr:hypothetical protein [Flavobacteriaceae bacterium]
MKKSLKNRFEDLENQFDVEVPNLGHFDRFQDRLEAKRKPKINYWKPLAIAASLLLMIGFLWPYFNTSLDLKDVSPQMEETQAYFTSVIDHELKELGKLESEDTKRIISDALRQIKILDKEYKNLTTQLKESNEDKIIVYAMIDNYQKRINVLKSVINQINNLRNTKYFNNENKLI